MNDAVWLSDFSQARSQLGPAAHDCRVGVPVVLATIIDPMSDPDHHSIQLEVAAGDVDVVIDQIWLCAPLAVGEQDSPTGVRFTVGFGDRDAAMAAMARLATWQPVLEAVAHDDWVTRWRQGASPHVSGPFRIRLPDHPRVDDHIELEIEPGVSFGFGHPSTLLALDLLADTEVAGAHVLDVGSGSGVLSIAAAKLGAARVDAVDIDPAAVVATADNARRNGVAVSVRLGSIDAAPAVAVDVIVSNLTVGTQAAVLPGLGARLAASTTVILSGLLDGQETTVAELLAGHDIVDARRLDGWTAVRLAVVPAAPHH